MIKLNNITKAFEQKTILHNIDLNVNKNEIICLLGSSGSGKTTILRLIAGLETPETGEIIIDNKTVSRNRQILIPPHQRFTGFIFQDLALWPHFTVYKNIAFGLKEQKKGKVKETVTEILDFFGLTEHAEKFPHQLSGGQKQLTAIARSLVLKPKVLLMDEPLNNLDVKMKHKILHQIKTLKQNFDLTIIYVTHDHKEAFAIADKIAVMQNGKIIETGTAEQIKNSNNEYVKYFLEY